MTPHYTIAQLNETVALVSFGNVIETNINRTVIALHKKLVAESLEGFIESVPAYSSLAVFYRHPASFEIIRDFLEGLLKSLELTKSSESLLELPVLYDGDDLDFVAEQHALSREEVVSIHTSKAYRVFMIGFLPGFPYMGPLDNRIATPRKKTPRTAVAAGSVGIAGMQTGIYPQSSPGGWQLIGRTPLRIFNTKNASPCLLRPGDSVKFYSISPTEFDRLNEY